MNLSNVSPTLRRHESEPGAGGPAENVRGKASDLKRQAGEALRTTSEKIKSTATEATQEVKDQAAGLAEDQKERAAERVGGYSSAMHSAAEKIEGDDPNIAWLTHNLADRVQRAADYLRQSDLQSLQRDVEDLGRRNPLVFFGGLFIAGLVVGNLVKASAGSSGDRDRDFRGSSDQESSFGDSAFAGYRASSDVGSSAAMASNPAVQGTSTPGGAGNPNPAPAM